MTKEEKTILATVPAREAAAKLGKPGFTTGAERAKFRHSRTLLAGIWRDRDWIPG